MYWLKNRVLHRRGIHSVQNKKILSFQMVVFTGLIFMASFLALYFFHQNSDASYATASKTLRFNYTLSNTSGKFIPHVNFSVKVPMAIDSIQNLVSINSTHKNELLKEDDNEQSVIFSINSISPHASKVVDLTLVVSTSDRPKYERINDADYLTAEKYIELDSPVIKILAAQLKGSSSPETAKNIYEWLVNNVTSSSYTAGNKGAQYLIEHKSGDCTEFSYAFVALARVNGIPARSVSGFWVPTESTIINVADYHDWAEFYDGKQWVLVDAQKQTFASNYQNYLSIENITAGKNSKRFFVSNEFISISLQ
jgi:transglutaminase-like putative cysteine protease